MSRGRKADLCPKDPNDSVTTSCDAATRFQSSSVSEVAQMQASFSAITSHQFISGISKRVHAQHKRMVEKEGRQAGGCPFGYKVRHIAHPTELDKFSGQPKIMTKRLEVEPEHAKVVQRIFRMYAEGLSANAIAVRLNAERVPSPGSYWDRKIRRSSSWMASSLSSNPERGCGILNNELYIGKYIWNRTKGRKHRKSGKIEYRPNPKALWVTEDRPQLRIISDDLWKAVKAAQTRRRGGRGDAIAKGIAAAKAARRGGADSRYLLGSILKCGSCNANLIGDGAKDYICPSYATGGCDNDLRVRRDDVTKEVFGPLHEHLFSDEAVRRQQAKGRAELERLRKEEQRAATKPVITKAMKAIDEQEACLRRLSLAPTALSAALTALEAKRADLLAKASGKSGERFSRAQRLIERLPEIAAGYRKLIDEGAKSLSDHPAVSAAREAIRRLLKDGTIVLRPNAAHTSLVGVVRFAELGNHELGLAGTHRKVKALAAGATPTRTKVQGNQEKVSFRTHR